MLVGSQNDGERVSLAIRGTIQTRRTTTRVKLSATTFRLFLMGIPADVFMRSISLWYFGRVNN